MANRYAKHRDKAKPGELRECPVCGAKHKKFVYCSPACYQVSYMLRQDKYNAKKEAANPFVKRKVIKLKNGLTVRGDVMGMEIAGEARIYR